MGTKATNHMHRSKNAGRQKEDRPDAGSNSATTAPENDI